MTFQLISIVHIFVCVLLVAIVLLQQGKGADVGATFGGGGETLFGASGADNFLTRVTTILAIVFMLTSVTLASNKTRELIGDDSSGIFGNIPQQAPATPETAENTDTSTETTDSAEEANPANTEATNSETGTTETAGSDTTATAEQAPEATTNTGEQAPTEENSS